MLLKNARLLDPASGIDDELDVALEGDRVRTVGRGLAARGGRCLDLAGLVICPGFIDMHVHLREPGQEWKETIATGTQAAARGGFTGIACMPNTIPVNDSRAVTELILSQARAANGVAVYPVACVTKGQQGDDLVEMRDLVSAGARAFSDDGKPVRSSLIMRRALEFARQANVPIIDHCEDLELVDGGVMNEGPTATRLGLRGWPGVAEDVIVQRDILLAEHTGGPVHIAHMSTARSADLVRDGKRRGVRVSCEVTPHHLLLTDETVGEHDTNAKMNPPLRAESDRQALLRALVDGTIDAIATDHAPHHADEKCVEFSLAPFGVVGLETAVSLVLDRLVRPGLISWGRMVELLSVAPARILRLAKGRLAPGDDADLTVLDPKRTVRVDPEGFASKGRNTPFAALELRGAPVLTIVGGRVVHDAL